MNYHMKFQLHRKNIGDKANNYILALRTLTTYATYVATLKNVTFSGEPIGEVEDLELVIDDSKSLAKKWINSPYSLMIGAPKNTTSILKNLEDYLDESIKVSGSSTFFEYINKAQDCCKEIIKVYSDVNVNIDDFQDGFDTLQSNLEDAEKKLIKLSEDLEKEISEIETLMNEISTNIENLLKSQLEADVKVGVGDILIIFGFFFSFAAFLVGGCLSEQGAAERTANDKKIKELQDQLDKLTEKFDSATSDLCGIAATLITIKQLIALHDDFSEKVGDLIETWNDLDSELDQLSNYISDAYSDAAGSISYPPIMGDGKGDVYSALDELRGIKEDVEKIAIDSFEIYIDSIRIGESDDKIDDVLNKYKKMEVIEYVKQFG